MIVSIKCIKVIQYKAFFYFESQINNNKKMLCYHGNIEFKGWFFTYLFT